MNLYATEISQQSKLGLVLFFLDSQRFTCTPLPERPHLCHVPGQPSNPEAGTQGQESEWLSPTGHGPSLGWAVSFVLLSLLVALQCSG